MPPSNASRRRGQSILEFAISFVGLVMFIYVLLNVWVWLNGILVGRQQAFQGTRVAAGQRGSAGAPVGYARPPIKLSGLPSSTGGDAPSGTIGLVIGEPPCTAAEPYYDQALMLADEAKNIGEVQIPPVSAQVGALANQVQSMAAACSSMDSKSQAGCFAGIAPYQAQLNAATTELAALEMQLQDKVNQAMAFVDQGKAACP